MAVLSSPYRAFPFRGGSNGRLTHMVWRPGSRDTVCGVDTFRTSVSSLFVSVSCVLCLRIAGLARLAAGREPPEST
jgi:hypothetical protein